MMVKRSMELYNVPILLETENSAKITETSTFVSAENLSLVQKTFVKKKVFFLHKTRQGLYVIEDTGVIGPRNIRRQQVCLISFCRQSVLQAIQVVQFVLIQVKQPFLMSNTTCLTSNTTCLKSNTICLTSNTSHTICCMT